MMPISFENLFKILSGIQKSLTLCKNREKKLQVQESKSIWRIRDEFVKNHGELNSVVAMQAMMQNVYTYMASVVLSRPSGFNMKINPRKLSLYMSANCLTSLVFSIRLTSSKVVQYVRECTEQKDSSEKTAQG
ncbi:hypothetical protein G5I_09383 [Acromyrmex echinatior]|uniref:Uncharacterized protein n=1 Tax=Acromyrmex echinatior TaxID=103372 RepID=F4WU28_ACREC|nr:hypothetical protein G5I_09383 [Acromyrmex echinatior]